MSEKENHSTPEHEDFEYDVKLDVEARVRQGVKAVLEEVLQEEMAEHLETGYRELSSTRRGERNGHHTRNLVTPVGKIEHLEVLAMELALRSSEQWALRRYLTMNVLEEAK